MTDCQKEINRCVDQIAHCTKRLKQLRFSNKVAIFCMYACVGVAAFNLVFQLWVHAVIMCGLGLTHYVIIKGNDKVIKLYEQLRTTWQQNAEDWQRIASISRRTEELKGVVH